MSEPLQQVGDTEMGKMACAYSTRIAAWGKRRWEAHISSKDLRCSGQTGRWVCRNVWLEFGRNAEMGR
jgi:hypothetical protein